VYAHAAGGGGMSWRAAGGPAPPGGVLARGSPARALHELVAVERERIGELLTALAESSAQVGCQVECPW
jgi:hypothetical protein